MNYPVSTIEDMYYACDPEKPISALDDSRYLDLWQVRGQQVNFANSILRTLKRFEYAQDTNYFRMLFSGHIGSGKTTELLRLKHVLEREKFFVVYFDVVNLLDISDIEYPDILLTIAEQLCVELEKHELNITDALLEDLLTWFNEEIIETEQKTTTDAEVKTEASLGGSFLGLGKLLAKITAHFKYSGAQRSVIREKVEKKLSVFMDKLNKLVLAVRQKVQQAGYQDCVIIVDGLEKMVFSHPKGQDCSNHHKLFVAQSSQLKINSHVIYTVPITLSYHSNLQGIFTKVRVMPMVKIKDQAGRESEGKTVLRELIEKRISLDSVFADTNAVDELIELSGGVMRDLMLLLRTTTETDDTKVKQHEIDYAKTELVKSYARQVVNLNDADKDTLKAVYHKQIDGTMSSYEKLANNRIILEYENGELWQALHPAVLELESIKKLLGIHKFT